MCLPRGPVQGFFVVVLRVFALFCTGLSVGVHCIHVWKCVSCGFGVGGVLLFVPVFESVGLELRGLVVLGSQHHVYYYNLCNTVYQKVRNISLSDTLQV